MAWYVQYTNLQLPHRGALSVMFVIVVFIWSNIFELPQSLAKHLGASNKGNRMSSSSQSHSHARRLKSMQNKIPQLTDEQKQELKEAFDLFDTNGSGTQHTRYIQYTK